MISEVFWSKRDKETIMNYLLRSMLFVPAYKEKFLEKAALCDADAIIQHPHRL